MTGLALSYVPDRKKNPLFVKFLFSGYKSLEQENLDIIGQYRLSQIETDINDPGAGEEVALLGTGTQHVYSRNVLQTNILNAEVKGGIELQQSPEKSNFIQAGLRATYQDFTDHIHEWERLVVERRGSDGQHKRSPAWRHHPKIPTVRSVTREWDDSRRRLLRAIEIDLYWCWQR